MLERVRGALASLWVRAFFVLALVVMAPAGFVWLSVPYEYTVAYRMRRDFDRAHHIVSEVTASDDVTRDAALARMAELNGVRLRVIDGAGQVRHDHDFSLGDSLLDLYGGLGFTAEDRVEIERYDDLLGPLEARPAVREARAEGRFHECQLAASRRLFVCQQVRTLGDAERGALGIARGPVVVHLQSASPRSIRSLYAARYQVLLLATQVAVVALLLGVWLGWRIVRPLKLLRDQVRERTAAPVSTQPVDVPARRDEVAELARSFNELLEAIERGRQANLSFVADVAHEIKNPIAAVRACSERLERGEDVSAARAARMGRALRTSSERMHQMIDRFLALARAEAGLPDERREPFDLARLVEGVVEALASDERYAEVTFEVDCRPAPVVGAPVRLETAARNLVDNAASLVGAGGEVRVSTWSEGERCYMRVEDDGPGIPTEELGRIFERFYTRRADDSGTGLGLAMTRAVVRTHHGAIEVESALGQGSIFTIVLPREPEGDAPSEALT